MRSQLYKELANDSSSALRNWSGNDKIILTLIYDFLSHHNMDYCLSVFIPESKCSSLLLGSSEVKSLLKLDGETKGPLLQSLVEYQMRQDEKLMSEINKERQAMEFHYSSEMDLLKDQLSQEHQRAISLLKDEISNLHQKYGDKLERLEQRYQSIDHSNVHLASNNSKLESLESNLEVRQRQERLTAKLEEEYQNLQNLQNKLKGMEQSLEQRIHQFDQYRQDKEAQLALNSKKILDMVDDLKASKKDIQDRVNERMQAMKSVLEEKDRVIEKLKESGNVKPVIKQDELKWRKSSLKWQNECKGLVLKFDHQVNIALYQVGQINSE